MKLPKIKGLVKLKVVRSADKSEYIITGMLTRNNKKIEEHYKTVDREKALNFFRAKYDPDYGLSLLNH